MSQHTCLY